MDSICKKGHMPHLSAVLFSRAFKTLQALMVLLIMCGFARGQGLAFNPGIISRVAGGGSNSSPTYAATGTGASLQSPQRAVFDTNGNIYFVEVEGKVVRVVASGKGAIPTLPLVKEPTAGYIYTIAGNGTSTPTCASSIDLYGDGCAAAEASFVKPYGLAVDRNGNVYISDRVANTVRVVYGGGRVPGVPSPQNGYIYALAGFPNGQSVTTDVNSALASTLNSPSGLSVDSTGNIFISDHRK